MDKMLQSNYLGVTLHVKRKKLLVDKIQNGDHVW